MPSSPIRQRRRCGAVVQCPFGRAADAAISSWHWILEGIREWIREAILEENLGSTTAHRQALYLKGARNRMSSQELSVGRSPSGALWLPCGGYLVWLLCGGCFAVAALWWLPSGTQLSGARLAHLVVLALRCIVSLMAFVLRYSPRDQPHAGRHVVFEKLHMPPQASTL